jgi:hypothetical protein
VLYRFLSQGEIFYYHAGTSATQRNPPITAQAQPSSTASHGQRQGSVSGGVHGAPPSGGQPRTSPSDSNGFVYSTRKEYVVQQLFGFGGEKFEITDAQTGLLEFKVKAVSLAWMPKSVLYDARGVPLYIRATQFSYRSRMHIQDAITKQTVINMRPQGLVLNRSVLQAWKGASDIGAPWLEVRVRTLKDKMS